MSVWDTISHWLQCPYLDVIAVSGEVHLHDEAGDVPAAVDAIELRAERQVVEVYSTLGGADGQVTRIRTKPERQKAPL